MHGLAWLVCFQGLVRALQDGKEVGDMTSRGRQNETKKFFIFCFWSGQVEEKMTVQTQAFDEISEMLKEERDARALLEVERDSLKANLDDLVRQKQSGIPNETSTLQTRHCAAPGLSFHTSR